MPARAYIYEPREKDRKAGAAGQLFLDGKPFPYYTLEAPKIEEPTEYRGSLKCITLVLPVYEVVHTLCPIVDPAIKLVKDDWFSKVNPGDDQDEWPPLVDRDLIFETF